MNDKNTTSKSILKRDGMQNNNKTKKNFMIDTTKNTHHYPVNNRRIPNSPIMKTYSSAIPNTLTIYIQTQVPGSQMIKYLPSMTFPSVQGKVVYFDPLVKLSQSIINQIPKEYQVFEFFDKQFFKSLTLKSSETVKTIKEATEKGIVDNNIDITLKNLFKKDSVFYINQNPYIISGYEWERGNWKIDTKISEIPSTYKGQYGISSIQYRKTLTEQLNAAKAELNTLPKDVIAGPNFAQPIVSIPKTTPIQIPKTMPIPLPKTIQIPKQAQAIKPPISEPIKKDIITETEIRKQPTTTIEVRNPNVPAPPTTTIEVRNPNVPAPPTTTIEVRNPNVPAPPTTAIEVRNPNVPASPTTAIELRNPNVPASPTTAIEVRKPNVPSIEDKKTFEIPVPQETNYNIENVKTSDARKYSTEIHKYFNQPKYKDLVVEVYKNTIPLEKNGILSNIRTYSDTTSSDVNATYLKTVSASHVKPNTGTGDCFYISIAEAINEHNEIVTDKDKITYMATTNASKIIYGIDKPFTQVVVRTAVANYILNDVTLLKQYVDLARDFVNEMNDDVEKQFQEVNKTDLSVSEATYNSIIDHVYQSNNNFFIIKNSQSNPSFKVTETRQEQIDYILGNSWADERIVQLMDPVLKLTVIPIQKIDNRLTIPMVESTTTNRFYMFVYHSANHYEQIYFSNLKLNRISIFDKTNDTMLPPSYILLLLYASYYYPMDPEQQEKVTFLKDILKTIDKSMKKILEANNKKTLTFTSNFEKLFPSKKSQTTARLASAQYNADAITGGALQNTHYTSHHDNKANISYYITITLNVYPGDAPSFKESSKAACSHNYSNLQKAWAEVLGKKYNIQPNYDLLPNNYSRKVFKQINTKNKTRKQ